MGTTPTEVMAFPNIRAIVRDNGTAEVVVAGNSRVVPAGNSVQELRSNALALVVVEAQTLQRPVRVQIEDPEGHGELIVHPDNKIESVSYEPSPPRRRAEAPETTPATVAPAIIDTVPAHPRLPPRNRSQLPLLRRLRRRGAPQPEGNLVPGQRPGAGTGHPGLAGNTHAPGTPDGPLRRKNSRSARISARSASTGRAPGPLLW